MLKFIKVSISALLTIILAPIAFLAATLLTDSGKDMSKVATFDKNQLVTNKMVTALSGMDKDNPKLNFTFNNDEMDSLFNYVYEKNIKSTVAGEYIKKFYCDAKDDNRWDFTVVGGWKFFNTKATLPTTLKVENENLVFRFDAPILGRLNTAFAREYIAQLAQSLKINSLLETPLQKLGIDGIKVDIEKEGTISIPKSGLMDYVAKLQDAQGQSTDSLVGALLSVFTSNSKDMISATTNKEIGLSLDLNNITKAAAEKQGYIAPTRDLLKSFEEGLSGYVDNVKKWADESQKELTEKEITQELSNEINNKSDLKKDGSAGGNFLSKVTDSIKDKNENTIISEATSGNGLSLGSIDSIDLFNYLRGNAIAGKTTTFSKKINGKYTINQITVEAIDFRFYTEDNKPRVSVFVPINVNDVVIMAILDYEISCDKNDKKIIVFGDEEDINNNSFYIGNKEITGKAKNNFVSLLTEINSNDETSSNPFKVTSTGAIKIDFCSGMTKDNKFIALEGLFNVGQLEIKCVDSNDASNDGGQIKFTLKATQKP